GIDSLTGVLPWRTGETFYNVPSNGPAAIMMARTDRLEQAMQITDWIFDNLIDVDGLVMDGLRMRMHGPELVRNIHPYCQGVALGACLEIALKLRERHEVSSTEVETWREAEKAEEYMRYIIHIRALVMRSPGTWPPPTVSSTGTPVTVTVGCSRGSWCAIWRRWRSGCPMTRMPTGGPGRRPPVSCWNPRRACGTTAWRLTACRCSPLTGPAMPGCRRTTASGPPGSMRSSAWSGWMSVISRCNCPVGCSWRPPRRWRSSWPVSAPNSRAGLSEGRLTAGPPPVCTANI